MACKQSLVVELLEDFKELANFSCGEVQMSGGPFHRLERFN